MNPSDTSKPPASGPGATRATLLRDGNFRWLISGGLLSMLGDQFTLIALPWWVLQMTGSTAVLGTVLALISVPRAVFILVGGAVVDRYSPKRVLMITKHINTVLLAALAAMVFSGQWLPWAAYALALGIGVSTAFSIPSATSMMPHVIAPAQLQAANGVMLGLRQLTLFVGPVLAGLLMVLGGDGADVGVNAGTGGAAAKGTTATGVGLAFAFDAFSFALSAWTLSHVQMRGSARRPSDAPQAVLSSVAQGLLHFWRDRELRTCFVYWAAIALFIMGPVHIALPVLASTTPGLGAAALGIIVGAHGAGTLLGMVASGVRPGLRLGSLGLTLLAMDALVGLLFMPMGHIHAVWQGAALMLLIGLLGGFMHVAVFTWIQQRVPSALLGRAMSLFMFIFMGLAPISAAVTGWLMGGVSLRALFVGCGAALLTVVVVAWVFTPLRGVKDAVAAAR